MTQSTLPFTVERFYGVFAARNEADWPMKRPDGSATGGAATPAALARSTACS